MKLPGFNVPSYDELEEHIATLTAENERLKEDMRREVDALIGQRDGAERRGDYAMRRAEQAEAENERLRAQVVERRDVAMRLVARGDDWRARVAALETEKAQGCGHDFDGLVREVGRAHAHEEEQAAKIAALEEALRWVDKRWGHDTEVRKRIRAALTPTTLSVEEDLARREGGSQTLPGERRGPGDGVR